jgi:hypothetical protein
MRALLEFLVFILLLMLVVSPVALWSYETLGMWGLV